MTTIAEAIRAFAAATDTPPIAAMQWAIAHWDAAAPRLLQMLEAYADGSDETDQTTDAMFFIVHLCGDRAERRAFPALCRLMLDEDRLIAALGDTAAVESLKGVVIRCFDGDTTPLRQVIESITRGEAMFAMAWLARDGQVPEPEFRDYLRHLLAEMQPREPDYIWYIWLVVAAILGYQEFEAESRQLIENGMVPPGWMTLEDYPALLASGDPVGKKGLLAEEVEPFDDVLTALADWPWDDDDWDAPEPAPQPYVNPMRHVGRNDPCPCGSGKKFKNCHLVVE